MADVQIAIVGAAGEGIQTVGDVVARAVLSQGFPVIAGKEYESRIRGGNNSYRIRIGDVPPPALQERADILLPLNKTAAAHYSDLLRSGGLVVDLPFAAIAEKTGGSKLYANSVAAGALVATLGIELSVLSPVLESMFARKKEDVLRANIAAATAGYSAASSRFSLGRKEAEHVLISAHEAIVLAATYSGCRFISAYPMSPSTGIITAFARDERLGVFAEQAEDEIAAINMALGASYAGARAMTATSGGGFALMVEALSLAGMTETPIVIVLAQRPGPATGLPTRTAQEDLLFAIHAGHGEFPKVVLAPADPYDAFKKTMRAFDLADRHQCPVIMLTDQYLADTHFCYVEFELPQAPSRSGVADPASVTDYHRYRLNADGISPRLYPGQSEHLVCVDSDEHDESGHITEDLRTVRPAMVNKRLAKMRGLKEEVSLPEGYHVADAETILIGWGSTRGAIREFVDQRRSQAVAIGSLHFTELWPLPDSKLPTRSRYITVEGNATGNLSRLLSAEYGIEIAETIGRSDGLPITAEWLEGRIDA